MNREEVEKFICQIALSGAVDFISKYENTEGGAPGIIGHFGLGFYSAFMVSDSVELITRSYTGAPAVRWVCSEAGDYEMSEGEREGRGTDVIMHVSEEGSEYLSELKLRDILDKYCSFMPVPIYFESVKTKAELEEEAKRRLPRQRLKARTVTRMSTSTVTAAPATSAPVTSMRRSR